jgi:alkylhydroperoxidase family enzyme
VREPSERADGLYDELLPKLTGRAELAPRERAALDFAEALAAARPSVDDALMARLRSVFTLGAGLPRDARERARRCRGVTKTLEAHEMPGDLICRGGTVRHVRLDV